MGLKIATIQGRLVRDPESRQTRGGTDICSFTVAVDSNRPAKGEEKPKASFFRVTVFGKRGQTAQQYLSKGDEVTVVGDLELDTYEAQDGRVHSNMQIVANEVHFGRKAQSNTGQSQQQRPQAAAQPRTQHQQDFGYDDSPVY
jgi:single-strand DNA-binding protein